MSLVTTTSAVAPVPEPHDPLSQSVPAWQTVALVVHVPGVVVPHALLSQSALLWQTTAVPFWHAPAVAPVPVPHELRPRTM